MDAPSKWTSNEGSAGGFSPEETLLILDWDDTVLPSTWLKSQGLLGLDNSSRITEAQREELSEVARAARETLVAAKRHGEVVVITNARRGWIELTCSKFMPALFPVLESVKLVSARAAYESLKSSPLDWKLFAFEAEIMRITKGRRSARNVLSVGDGPLEREALLRVASQLPDCRWKSVQFLQRPTASRICEQHALMTKFLQEMVGYDGNLDTDMFRMLICGRPP